MTHQDIMTELEQNGERSSGFYDEDARKLQAIYDAGFQEYVAKVKEARKTNKLRAQKQLRLQKKRLLHERQLNEEAEASAERGGPGTTQLNEEAEASAERSPSSC